MKRAFPLNILTSNVGQRSSENFNPPCLFIGTNMPTPSNSYSCRLQRPKVQMKIPFEISSWSLHIRCNDFLGLGQIAWGAQAFIKQGWGNWVGPSFSHKRHNVKRICEHCIICYVLQRGGFFLYTYQSCLVLSHQWSPFRSRKEIGLRRVKGE